MTLAEATSGFLGDATHGRLSSADHEQTLSLLASIFDPAASLSEITPARLRDFLSRWYVEQAAGSKQNDSRSGELENPASSRTLENLKARKTAQVPKPLELLDSLEEFFKWADQQTGANRTADLSPIFVELRHSLPRALEITKTLTSALRERGGAFHFPEFLTSFEEGGSSQYDIDAPGNVGAIDGYFRIVRVEGSSVDAEELITEERVWPIVFPSEVAALLDEGWIISLELVRKPEGWQIAGCGFAYPPGTEI